MITNATVFYDIYNLRNDAERETLTRWRTLVEAKVATDRTVGR